jgi:tripartite-type tricarboxylate transporter receptor subunit TctC
MYSIKRRQILIALAGLLAAGGTVHAQDFPSQSIRVVVPYPPGGIVDPAARLMATTLAPALGQAMFIDNRPGAAGAIGISAVASSKADGHTLLFHSSTITTSATVQHENAKIDVKSVLTPVAIVGSSPFLIVVNPNVPVKNIQELIAYAKANPGKLSYGSSGRGSSNHLAAELFKRMAGVDMLHVPYQGGGPAVNALVGGQIQVGFDTITGSGQLVKAGRLRAIAVTSLQRSKALPDVPTVHESGLPNYEVNFWLGYFAPANTPAPVVNKLVAAVLEATAKPEMVEKLAGFGLERSNFSSAQFSGLFQSEINKWDRLLKSLGNAQ